MNSPSALVKFLSSPFRPDQLLLILWRLHQQLVPFISSLKQTPPFRGRPDDLKLAVLKLQKILVLFGFNTKKEAPNLGASLKCLIVR